MAGVRDLGGEVLSAGGQRRDAVGKQLAVSLPNAPTTLLLRVKGYVRLVPPWMPWIMRLNW